MKKRSVPKVSAASGGERNVKTCRDYFKVKKSPSEFAESKLPIPDCIKTSHRSSVEAHTRTRDQEVTVTRLRRSRYDLSKQNDVKHQDSSALCIEDVQMLVAAQDSYDGGVNCYVCGKLYKSKVCFIKHIWEHTVYWHMFEKAKNHERVLAIQAAIILYCGLTSQPSRAPKSDLCNLLVTAPHSSEMKQERDGGVIPNSGQLNEELLVLLSETCSERSPLAIDNLNEKSNEKAVRNVCTESANKHSESVVSNGRCTLLDSSIQKTLSSSDTCWQPSVSQITHPNSHELSAQKINTTNFTVYSPTVEPQSYPIIFSTATTPSMYPIFLPPTSKLSVSPIFSLPKPQVGTASAVEKQSVLMFARSLPIQQQQLSPNSSRGCKNSGHTSAGIYSLESNGTSFVSPLKRKRED